MIPEEIDKIVFRLTAAWPRPPIPIETLAIWNEHLRPLQFRNAWDAVMMMEKTKSRQPSLAEFHEAYGACRPTTEQMPAIESSGTYDEEAHDQILGIIENLARMKATLPKSMTNAPTRKPRMQFLPGSPARREGTKTSRSVEFGVLRYDQVYDENGNPR